MRFPLEVFAAVREAWPEHKPISVRISATDWVPGGFDGDDAVAVRRELKALGCDIVDVSTGQTTIDADPDYGRLYQTPYSDRIRTRSRDPDHDRRRGVEHRRRAQHPGARAGPISASWPDPTSSTPTGRSTQRSTSATPDFDFPNQYLSGLNARRRLQDPIPPEVFRG